MRRIQWKEQYNDARPGGLSQVLVYRTRVGIIYRASDARVKSKNILAERQTSRRMWVALLIPLSFAQPFLQ